MPRAYASTTVCLPSNFEYAEATTTAATKSSATSQSCQEAGLPLVGHTHWQLLIWQVRHPFLAAVDLYSAGLFKRTARGGVGGKKTNQLRFQGPSTTCPA